VLLREASGTARRRARKADYARAEQVFREFLAARGLRLTRSRREVLRAVMRLEIHFGRNRLLGELAGSGVHRATMFRTLPLLVEAGVLRRMRESLDHWHYEHVIGHQHHHHLLCARCGRAIEVVSPVMERERRRLCARHDFEETSHSFMVRGICARCRRRRRRRGGSPGTAPSRRGGRGGR
jgi:Fur family ferric uptake transcriptional regulator